MHAAGRALRVGARQAGLTADGVPLDVVVPRARRPALRTLSSFALPDGEVVRGLQAEILLNLLEVLVRSRTNGQW